MTKREHHPLATLAAIREAIEDGEKTISQLMGERLVVLRQLARSDPAKVAREVRDIDQRIAEARTALRTLEDVLATAEADAAEAARQERVEQARALVAAGMASVETAVGVAKEADEALRAAVEAVRKLRAVYANAVGPLMRAIGILHQDNPMKGFDATLAWGSYATGQNIDHARALARYIEHALQALGGSAVREEVIVSDRFVGHREGVPTFEEAAQIALDRLRRNFGDTTMRRIEAVAAEAADPLPQLQQEAASTPEAAQKAA